MEQCHNPEALPARMNVKQPPNHQKTMTSKNVSPRLHLTATLAMAISAIGTAGIVSAATLNYANNWNYSAPSGVTLSDLDYYASTDDLANAGQPTLASAVWSGGTSGSYGSSPAQLNNGLYAPAYLPAPALYIEASGTDSTLLATPNSTYTINFTGGMDITSIVVHAAMTGETRAKQNWKLEYRTAGSGTYTAIVDPNLDLNVAQNRNDNRQGAYYNKITLTAGAGELLNVNSLRFTFLEPMYWAPTDGANSTMLETGYREIDVFGTAAPVPTYAGWAADNTENQAANLDFDNDGVSNGVEYFMNAATGFTANPSFVGNTVTWSNGGNIPSSEYPSQFEVQTSTDLANWSAVASDDINLSNTAGALTWKVASIANGNMDSFPTDLPGSWVVSGGALTSAPSPDNSPFTNKFADNGNSWLIDDSTDAVGTAGFLQAFSNKTNYPSVEVNFDFKLTELTGGTWGIQFDGAGAELVTGSSSVHYRIDAAGQFAINAGPGTGVITNILTLEADMWYNVRATFTTTAVNTGSNEGTGVQSGTITPAGGSPVSWSNVPLLNTSLGFSRLLVRDRDATFAGDLLLDNVSVAPLLGKQFVRLKVTPN
jgi:hypothetical protein